jgi:transcription antitermination protein NusB
MGHRRKAREYALQGLYIYEVSKTPVSDLTRLDWVDDEIPDDIRSFASSLITLSVENISDIDTIIINHSKNWKFERLSYVDKSILRLSICELMYMGDIPNTVTINEGIELGKIYGGENSGQFINGILDAVNRDEASGKDAV